MISSLQWVRRGAAQARPDKYDLDEREYKRIGDIAAQQLAQAKEDLEEAQNEENPDSDMAVEKLSETNPELNEYNLDGYDDERPEGE
ncbi:hypothetical protein BGW38_003502, partial [Lunasporangiospora selenospora]